MRWDRKLAALAAVVLILAAVAAGALIFFTQRGIETASARIAGEAQAGYEDFLARVKKPENIFSVTIARRGKFEGQRKYRDFQKAWLTQMERIPGEFLDGDVSYTHQIRLRLKSYAASDTVFSHRDAESLYTRYDDSAVLLRDGDLFYVTYQTGNTEYHFIASCPPLSAWLDSIRDASING